VLYVTDGFGRVARFDATSGTALPDLVASDGHTLVNPQFMAFSVPELSSLMMFLSAAASLGLWKVVRGRRRYSRACIGPSAEAQRLRFPFALRLIHVVEPPCS
jgi:hypothetical protein